MGATRFATSDRTQNWNLTFLVKRIIVRDLDINMYHRVKAQNLKQSDEEKQVERE